MSALDRPVWASLTTTHRGLSEGDSLARRHARDVNLFAAARDQGPDALARLAGLVPPGERVFVVEAGVIPEVPDLVVEGVTPCVQMVDTGADPVGGEDQDIVPLGTADAMDMLALARLTRPGPFLAKTHLLGDFLGIRVDGHLVAMAGQRMRFPGHAEVSGVCTHPDYQSRGYARRLSRRVMALIRARGATPFLHAWTSNESAIALYKSLGFRARRDLMVSILARPIGRGSTE